MALITCKECGKDVSPNAKTCASCGATVPNPGLVAKAQALWSGYSKAGKLMVVVGIGSLAVLMILNAGGSSTSESASVSAKPKDFAALRARDNIDAAKAALDGGNVAQAMRHLSAIPKDTAEYKTSQPLRQEAERKQGQLAERAREDQLHWDQRQLRWAEETVEQVRQKRKTHYASDADVSGLALHGTELLGIVARYVGSKDPAEKRLHDRAMAILPRLQALGREAYASSLENQYMKTGMDVRVEATGDGRKTLRIQYALMSQPVVYKLQNETRLGDHAAKLGFVKLIYTNGFRGAMGDTWTIDLAKKRAN